MPKKKKFKPLGDEGSLPAGSKYERQPDGSYRVIGPRGKAPNPAAGLRDAFLDPDTGVTSLVGKRAVQLPGTTGNRPEHYRAPNPAAAVLKAAARVAGGYDIRPTPVGRVDTSKPKVERVLYQSGVRGTATTPKVDQYIPGHPVYGGQSARSKNQPLTPHLSRRISELLAGKQGADRDRMMQTIEDRLRGRYNLGGSTAWRTALGDRQKEQAVAQQGQERAKTALKGLREAARPVPGIEAPERIKNVAAAIKAADAAGTTDNEDYRRLTRERDALQAKVARAAEEALRAAKEALQAEVEKVAKAHATAASKAASAKLTRAQALVKNIDRSGKTQAELNAAREQAIKGQGLTPEQAILVPTPRVLEAPEAAINRGVSAIQRAAGDPKLVKEDPTPFPEIAARINAVEKQREGESNEDFRARVLRAVPEAAEWEKQFSGRNVTDAVKPKSLELTNPAEFALPREPKKVYTDDVATVKYRSVQPYLKLPQFGTRENALRHMYEGGAVVDEPVEYTGLKAEYKDFRRDLKADGVPEPQIRRAWVRALARTDVDLQDAFARFGPKWYEETLRAVQADTSEYAEYLVARLKRDKGDTEARQLLEELRATMSRDNGKATSG